MSPRLLVAAGGGGDALAALLIDHALHGSDHQSLVVASFSWDRFLFDPQPGPRSPQDFTRLRRLSAHNWEVTDDSALAVGRSTLPLLARHTHARFVLLDARDGVAGLREQLTELAHVLDAKTITLIDVGGDIVACGDEDTLLSPLADSMTLAALDGLNVAAQVVVAGAGLDGELPTTTARQRCNRLACHVVRLRQEDVQPYLSALTKHPSEATTLLAAAALGVRGRAEIRDRGSLVPLDDQSASFHVIDPQALLGVNEIAQKLTATASMAEAEQVTLALRGTTELEHERHKAFNAPTRPEQPTWDALAERYANYRQAALSRGVSVLTFRRLAEVIGLPDYSPETIRRIVGSDAHPRLPICQLV